MKILKKNLGGGSQLPSIGFTRPSTNRAAKARCWSWAGHGKLLILFALLTVPGLLFAQQYSINWYKVAGGGGTSTNSQFCLSGTMGQPDASAGMSGGAYSLTGGFWALFGVVQTPGAPTLYISYSGSTLTVFWQAVSGFTLQQNSNLEMANWADSGYSFTTSNGTNYVSITGPLSGSKFYRLIFRP